MRTDVAVQKPVSEADDRLRRTAREQSRGADGGPSAVTCAVHARGIALYKHQRRNEDS